LFDTHGQEEQESALVTTLGVIEAKLSRARGKLGEAEGVVSRQVQSVRSVFGTLYQNYRLWHVEREKKKLLGQLDGTCPFLAVDQVTIHLRVIADLARLELAAVDAPGVIRQAETLLSAIAEEREFILPAVNVVAAPGEAGSTGTAVAENWSGPWDDGTVDIQGEIKALQAEDPAMKLPAMHERLRATFPRLYQSSAEVAAMNAPLPGLATGVYEARKSGEYELVEPK
jgi:hypothetical protein